MFGLVPIQKKLILTIIMYKMDLVINQVPCDDCSATCLNVLILTHLRLLFISFFNVILIKTFHQNFTLIFVPNICLIMIDLIETNTVYRKTKYRPQQFTDGTRYLLVFIPGLCVLD